MVGAVVIANLLDSVTWATAENGVEWSVVYIAAPYLQNIKTCKNGFCSKEEYIPHAYVFHWTGHVVSI